MNIEFISGTDINSGYEKASRAYMRILREMGHNVFPHTLYPDPKPDIRFLHTCPYDQCIPSLDLTIPTIYMYAWELPQLPLLFKQFSAQFPHCITFSHFQESLYKAETGRTNITCIPHPPLSETGFRKRVKNPLFTFLSVGRWDERKDNVSIAAAFAEAFPLDTTVQLIMKITHGDTFSIMKKLGPYVAMSNIQLLQYDFPEAEMHDLYQSADVYVSATRGEGWGYGFQEALLNGVPCIYPRSPYIVRSFFNKYNSIGVNCRDVPVSKDWECSVWFDGREFTWSQIDVAGLSHEMKYCREQYPFKLPVFPAVEYYQDQETIRPKFTRIIEEFAL